MDIGGLFDEELEFTTTQVNGLTLRHMQQDAGQLKSGMPLVIWPAAYVLAEFLISHVPTGSSVIELGAGTGLVGLSLSKQRPDLRVCITDGEETSLELIRENAASNGCNVEVFQLSWGPVSADLFNQFDYVVGSDVVYAAKAVRPLLIAIQQLMKPQGVTFLANFKHRYNLHEATLQSTAMELGLDQIEQPSTADIRLIRLTNQSTS